MISNFGLFVLVLTPLWSLVLHAAASRIFKSFPAQKVAIASIWVTVISSILVSLIQLGPEYRSLSSFLFSLVMALGGGHLYFHFFNMGETARRIRILTQLRLSIPAGEDYTPEKILEVRLGRLVTMGQLEPIQEKFKTRSTFFLIIALSIKKYEYLLFPNHKR